MLDFDAQGRRDVEAYFGVKSAGLMSSLADTARASGSAIRNAAIGAPGAWGKFKDDLAHGTMFAPGSALHDQFQLRDPATNKIRWGNAAFNYALPAAGIAMAAQAPAAYRGTSTGGATGATIGSVLGMPLGAVGSTVGGMVGGVAGQALGSVADQHAPSPTPLPHDSPLRPPPLPGHALSDQMSHVTGRPVSTQL